MSTMGDEEVKCRLWVGGSCETPPSRGFPPYVLHLATPQLLVAPALVYPDRDKWQLCRGKSMR